MIKKVGFRLFVILGLILNPLIVSANIYVNSMLIFGDSLSDDGNTTHLLKSIKNEADPAFLVRPFKAYVINRMVDFSFDYHIPQTILDIGIATVTEYFDYELAPMIANLLSKIRIIPILPNKPYWHFHFSNGPVWNEYLAPMMGISTDDEEMYVNKAFGGSWVQSFDYQLSVWNFVRYPLDTLKTLIVGKLVPPSLGLTVQAHLLEHDNIDKNTAVFLFSGSNDYINILTFEDNYNPSVMSLYIDNVINTMDYNVKRLVQAGAKHMVIMGISHLGDTPKHVGTDKQDVLNAAADEHNVKLQEHIKEWQALMPEVDFLYVDIQQLFQKVLDNPTTHFVNTQSACIDVKLPMFQMVGHPFSKNLVMQYAKAANEQLQTFWPGKKHPKVCDSPSDYLFWDEIHPSTRAHAMLAKDICLLMKDHGYQINCNRA